MYHCIICKSNFEIGLRIFIEKAGSLGWVYVCENCSHGKKEAEICHLASIRADLAENSFHETPAAI